VGLSGLIALLLASAGLYGVMAYRVNQRTREIGLRMALGATRGVVAGGVVRRGSVLVLAGVVIGTVGALALARFIEGLVFGVTARDPASLVAAPLILAVVAILAALIPARRAMRVDPMTAMRAD